MRLNYKSIDVNRIIKKKPFWGVWSLMTGFRWKYVTAVICLSVAALCKTFTFILLKYFIDTIQKHEFVVNTLFSYAGIFLCLAFLEAIASFLRGTLASKAAEGVTLRLRDNLFDHIQHLSFTYHDHMQTGELIERVTSDVDTLRRFFADQATEIGSIIILFVFNLTAMIQLNAMLGMVSVVFLPLILFLSVFFFIKILKAFAHYQNQEAKLSTVLQENITAMRIVRAFARKDYEVKKFEVENAEKFKRGRKLVMLNNLFWPLTDIICVMQTLLIIALGGFMAISGQITAGSFIAITGLLANIIWPIRNLGRIVVEASTTFVSYKRVLEILAEPPEAIRETNDCLPIKGEIVFDHVSLQYKGSDNVLTDISFSCKAGERIALLGTTGSGKTSLINLLPRFYEYTSGKISIDGRELTDYPLYALRSQIGIIEQEPFLFSATIRENIQYGCRHAVSEQEIIAAATAAAMHDVIMEFPEAYGTRVGERGITLSGGQKQRLALARTLLKNPGILILDDATSSVDTVTETQIQKALEKLMQNRSCFIIAHRIQTVMNADKILVLDEGRIVQQGNHQSLINEDGLYRKIFQDQFEVERTIEEIIGG